MSYLSADLASASPHELLCELDAVERAIARGSTYVRWVDRDGTTQVRVSRELLDLAEREHAIVNELRRRHGGRSAAWTTLTPQAQVA